MYFNLNFEITKFAHVEDPDDYDHLDMHWVEYCCECGEYEIDQVCSCGHAECSFCGEYVFGILTKSNHVLACELVHITSQVVLFKQCDNIYLTIESGNTIFNGTMGIWLTKTPLDGDVAGLTKCGAIPINFNLPCSETKQCHRLNILAPDEGTESYAKTYMSRDQYMKLKAMYDVVTFMKEHNDLPEWYRYWPQDMKVMTKLYLNEASTH